MLTLQTPSVAELAGFLVDPDDGVRRTAVSTLIEHLPDGYEAALLDALRDGDGEVRRVAADGVRELVEVLPDPEGLAGQLSSPDPVVRARLPCICSVRAGSEIPGSTGGRWPMPTTGYASRRWGRWCPSTTPRASPSRPATTTGKSASRRPTAGDVAGGADAVRGLVGDRDPLVRAAALAALGAVGCGDDDVTDVQRALTEPAWQVREGAARALAGAAPTVAVPTLSRALADQHLDVRKAAVLSLTRWASSEPAARVALELAVEDGDADVRAYARRALARAG